MPLYTYQNPDTGEVKDVFQSMKEEHTYSENGVKWNRVWNNPNASIDSSLDPNNPKDFVKYTESRKGSLGDLYDLSAELSHKRGGQTGQDEFREKYFSEYSKKRRGLKHPDQIKRESEKKLKKFGIEIVN